MPNKKYIGIRLDARKNALMVEVLIFSKKSLREDISNLCWDFIGKPKGKRKPTIWHVQISNSEGDLKADLPSCFIFQAHLFLWWSFFHVGQWLKFWVLIMIIHLSFQTKILTWKPFCLIHWMASFLKSHTQGRFKSWYSTFNNYRQV